MQKGEVEFCMYQMAVKHFRPPLLISYLRQDSDTYFTLLVCDTYVVRDDLEQQLGLFKIYQADDDKEEKQIYRFMEGIRHISALGMTTVTTTSPIDFGLAEVDSPFKQYMSLFTIPEGKTLKAHIRYLGAQKNTLERNQALEMVRSGYQQAARGLAELHTKRFSPLCKISEYYWKFHMDTCRALVKSINSYAKKLPFSVAEFSDKLIRLAAYAYQKPCSAAYLHGNPVASSLNYEPFSGVLMLMDLENSFHSIDERGLPCGPSAYDFVWAESSMELQMCLIDAGYDELMDVIYDYRLTYREAMRERFAEPHHLVFYSVLFWLPVYKKLLLTCDGDPDNLKDWEKRLFKLALARIEALLTFKGPK